MRGQREIQSKGEKIGTKFLKREKVVGITLGGGGRAISKTLEWQNKGGKGLSTKKRDRGKVVVQKMLSTPI